MPQQKSSKRNHAAPVPAALRLGGAFLALAVVLALFLIMDTISLGWGTPFAFTVRRNILLVAAMLVGGFAMTAAGEKGAMTQIGVLATAVVLIIFSRLVPNSQVFVTEQFWVIGWIVVAVLCALLLRRSVTPRS